jgi:hypothetical protein
VQGNQADTITEESVFEERDLTSYPHAPQSTAKPDHKRELEEVMTASTWYPARVNPSGVFLR